MVSDSCSTQIPRLLEGVAASHGHPHLDAPLASGLGQADDAQVLQRGAIQPGQGQDLFPGRLLARVDVDQRKGRLVRARSCARSRDGAPGPPPAPARPWWPPRRPRRSPWPPRGRCSSQRLTHFGAWPGTSFCQKPLRAAAIREALQVKATPCEVREQGGPDADVVAEQVALGVRRLIRPRPGTAPCRGW